MFANRIGSLTSCSISPPEPCRPVLSRGFLRPRSQSCNTSYSELLAPLVKAVQQQQQEIAAAADDNASLKRLFAAQQNDIELMKLQIQILAQPHPAQIDLPTSLPARPTPEGDK
jgi:hypothetical protein